MRKGLILFSILLLGFTVPLGMANAQTRLIDKRENVQKDRIKEGVRSGELTRGETRRLVRGQRRVHRMERRANSDGNVTLNERRHINRAQNRQSRRIYRKKHNRRGR